MTNILMQIQDTLVRKLDYKFITTVLHYSPMPNDNRLFVQITSNPHRLTLPSQWFWVTKSFEQICNKLSIPLENKDDHTYILTIPNNDLIAFHGALELIQC